MMLSRAGVNLSKCQKKRRAASNSKRTLSIRKSVAREEGRHSIHLVYGIRSEGEINTTPTYIVDLEEHEQSV